MKNKLGYDVVIQTLRTANVLWRESRRFFQPYGITEAQFNVMHLLGQEPKGLSQRELSDLLVVDRSNVTLLLDRMEKSGWITRQDVPGDRRVYRVSLTKSGKALWERVLPHYNQAIQDLVKGLPQGELKATLKILKAIETLVKGETIRN